MISQVLRLALLDTLRNLGALRWLVVPPLLLAAGYVELDFVEFDYLAEKPRDANFWDLPFSMMAGYQFPMFVLALGFVLVTGDLYVRDRALGTASMTLLRSRSRAAWWMAKVIALGALSLIYSIVSFLTVLALSAVMLPLEWGASPAARAPWGSEQAIYPLVEGLPMPLALLLVVLYTALGLWAVGSVVLGASLFSPHALVPLAVGIGWVVVLSWIVAPMYLRQGIGKLDPIFHLSYVIHYGTSSFDAVPWFTSFAVFGCTLALVMVLGALWLRGTDM